MKLIIDRKRWLRGEGPGPSRLLREEDNKMCCLGFYSLAKGATEAQIYGLRVPNQSKELCKLMPELIRTDNGTVLSSDNTLELMVYNDCRIHAEVTRESKIKEHFKNIGVEVEFIN